MLNFLSCISICKAQHLFTISDSLKPQVTAVQMRELSYAVLQVFCGKIPNSVFEDSLIPLFENCGDVWDLRLMMDPSTGLNKTFCFVMFTTKAGAQNAVKQVCFVQQVASYCKCCLILTYNLKFISKLANFM